MSVEFCVLGPLAVSVDGETLRLGGAKQQLVLAALLLEPNRVVSVDRLVEWVWNDDAAAHTATLQVYVSNLRRLLAPIATTTGGNPLVTERPGYAMRLADDQLDLSRFEQLRQAGEIAVREERHADAVGPLREALGLWRGEPLAGLPLDLPARGSVSRLEVARATTTEQLAEAELALGHHQQVVNELRGWVSNHPLNERLRGQLMLALYRCGWQAEALATFKEGRDLLVEELGIDPSRELRDLENQVLVQDPALDWVSLRPKRDFATADATVLRSSIAAVHAEVRVGDQVIPVGLGTTTIGRLPDRDVVILDPRASRAHAEIRFGADGYLIVDSGSGNGTTIGGQRIREQLLADGDVIVIGDTEIEFRVLGDQPPLA